MQASKVWLVNLLMAQNWEELLSHSKGREALETDLDKLESWVTTNL